MPIFIPLPVIPWACSLSTPYESNHIEHSQDVISNILTVKMCVDSVSGGIAGSSTPETTWTLIGLRTIIAVISSAYRQVHDKERAWVVEWVRPGERLWHQTVGRFALRPVCNQSHIWFNQTYQLLIAWHNVSNAPRDSVSMNEYYRMREKEEGQYRKRDCDTGENAF